MYILQTHHYHAHNVEHSATKSFIDGKLRGKTLSDGDPLKHALQHNWSLLKTLSLQWTWSSTWYSGLYPGSKILSSRWWILRAHVFFHVWDGGLGMTKPDEELDIFTGVGQNCYRQQSDVQPGSHGIQRVTGSSWGKWYPYKS